jgi:hypothetical protein
MVSWVLTPCIILRHGIRDRPPGQLLGAPTNKPREHITWIIGNILFVNSGFHTRKDFSKIYPQFGQAYSIFFFSPVLSRQRLQNIGLNRRQINILPWALTPLRPALGLLGDRNSCPQDDGSIFLKNISIHLENCTVLEFANPQFELPSNLLCTSWLAAYLFPEVPRRTISLLSWCIYLTLHVYQEHDVVVKQLYIIPHT